MIEKHEIGVRFCTNIEKIVYTNNDKNKKTDHSTEYSQLSYHEFHKHGLTFLK